MKVSRQQAADNRQRIVALAARRFREHGLDGIGVAELMKQAGLTHGGFYGQFASRQALVEEATALAVDETLQSLGQLAASDPAAPHEAIYQGYLSEQHRQNVGLGCLVAALGGELARQPGPVRHAVSEGIRQVAEQLGRHMPGRTEAIRRQQAMAAYASLIGSLIVLRTLDDPQLADEWLQASLAHLPRG